MKRFAEVLSRQLDLPVIDQTGLEGAFNINLKWSRTSDQPGDPGPSVFTALQQFGLRLSARKAPIELLVVDHAEMPEAN
jgi:uncharacterized protein (TIGR03435 family)